MIFDLLHENQSMITSTPLIFALLNFAPQISKDH